VIRRRPRHPDIPDQRRTLHGPRPRRKVEQHIEGPPDCW